MPSEGAAHAAPGGGHVAGEGAAHAASGEVRVPGGGAGQGVSGGGSVPGEGAGEAVEVVDAPGAEVLVVDGRVVTRDFAVQPVGQYDASLPLGNVTWEAGADFGGDPAYAWNVAQTLAAAQALGGSEAALAMAVEYAKQRQAFGRAIGSFQAVKHQLTDVLRLNENARSLVYYAAYAAENEPGEFELAANAARFAADQAFDMGTRRCLSVHGGLGATWEHDAHLYFRRAQLTRLLLGGQAAAGEKVVGNVIPG